MAKWTMNQRINLKVVVLCFSIATTFWFFQAMNRNYDSEITYPLNVVYDESSFVSVGEPTKEIEVNVTGYGWNLFFKNLGFKKEVLTLDMATLDAADFVRGTSITNLLRDQIPDCEVNYVATDTVFLFVDHKQERELHLRIDAENLGEGVVVNSVPEIVPNIIHVKGPQRVLKELPDPYRIQISRLNEGHSLRDYKFRVQDVLPASVLSSEKVVQINVEAAKYDSRVLSVPVEPLGFPFSDFSLPKVEVTCVADVHQQLSPAQIQVLADYKTFRASDKTVRLRVVNKPDFVKSVKINPVRVEVSPID